MHKKGQVTTFVIIGIIVIVVLALFIFIFRAKLGITPTPQNTEELTNALQSCLQQQLDISIVHPAFASFPTVEMSSVWLQTQIKDAFIEHCASIAEDYPGATVQKDATTAQVLIQGPNLNEFETIRATINLPVTITQGGLTETLPDIIAEVDEKQ